jgi:hypothetical protein
MWSLEFKPQYCKKQKTKQNKKTKKNPIKLTMTIWSSNPPARYISKGNEIGIWKDICTPMFIQHYSQSPRCENNLSIDRWMDKENVVHIGNRTLLSHKKKWTCHLWNMDEPGGYCAKWNKPSTETNTKWSHSYIDSEDVDLIRVETRKWRVEWLGREGVDIAFWKMGGISSSTTRWL